MTCAGAGLPANGRKTAHQIRIQLPAALQL